MGPETWAGAEPLSQLLCLRAQVAGHLYVSVRLSTWPPPRQGVRSRTDPKKPYDYHKDAAVVA
jgi:hypothetical protein